VGQPALSPLRSGARRGAATPTHRGPGSAPKSSPAQMVGADVDDPQGEPRVKHTARKSKKRRGLVARSITYTSAKRPRDRPRELIVDVPHGEVMDADYAAAMVAVRTGMPLAEVTIVAISGGE
jgi:hypothetical protein